MSICWYIQMIARILHRMNTIKFQTEVQKLRTFVHVYFRYIIGDIWSTKIKVANHPMSKYQMLSKSTDQFRKWETEKDGQTHQPHSTFTLLSQHREHNNSLQVRLLTMLDIDSLLYVKVCKRLGRMIINAISHALGACYRWKYEHVWARLIINAICQRPRVCYKWKYVHTGARLTISAIW